MKKKYTVVISLILALCVALSTVLVFASESIYELRADNCEVTLSAYRFTYSGEAKTPDVSVTYNNGTDTVELTAGTDFSTEYRDNIAAGKATVIIKGINLYSGELSESYFITPKKMSLPDAAGKDLSSITVQWTALDNADGYDLAVFKPNTGKWAHYDNAADVSSYKVVNLLPLTKYTVKVRAYKLAEDEKIYGAYSDERVITTNAAVAKPAADGYCNLTSKPVVTWKQAKNAKKYIVYRSLYKDKGFKQVATLGEKSRSYTDKAAKVHKTYYYRVKGWRTYKGKDAYSAASNIVKIKAKKTVFVGDSIMEGVKEYKALKGGTFLTKIGMGTYTFYEKNYFKVGKQTVTGVEKLISMKPDRVFIMFGMNEAHYKGNAGIIEYYEYAIEDLQDEIKNVEIVILPISPTKAKSGKTIPKKKRIVSFNKAAKKMAGNMDCKYYDYTEPFKDKNGNLVNKYDGGDGCHWNSKACKVFVSQMLKYAKANK